MIVLLSGIKTFDNSVISKADVWATSQYFKKSQKTCCDTDWGYFHGLKLGFKKYTVCNFTVFDDT